MIFRDIVVLLIQSKLIALGFLRNVILRYHKVNRLSIKVLFFPLQKYCMLTYILLFQELFYTVGVKF